MAEEKDQGNSLAVPVVHRVAFFMDFDNMIGGDTEKGMNPATMDYINNQLLQLGIIEHAAIYTDVRHIATTCYYDLLTKAYVLGIRTIHCPKLNGSEEMKDTVDENLAHDAYNLLEHRPDIDTFVFATQDRNFLPIINYCKQRRKKVILVLNSQTGSKSLQQIADQTINLAEIDFPSDKAEFTTSLDLQEFLMQAFASPDDLINAVKVEQFDISREFRIAIDIVRSMNMMRVGQYSFQYHLDWLRDQGKFELSDMARDESILKAILSTLNVCNVILKRSTATKKYYLLNREHAFVQVALSTEHLDKIKALFQD